MMINHVEAYLDLRRAGGFDLKNDCKLLKNFAIFADAHGLTHLSAGTAIEWAAQASSAAQRDRRLNTVIRFARYLRLEDSRHELPSGGVFGHHRQRPVPYVFSKAEVTALLKDVDCLPSSDPSRRQTCRFLFGLLVATGLRISEALTLRLEDLTDKGLLIRETKFHKSRILPLQETTATALDNYCLRYRPKVADDHLFVRNHGKRLTYFIARESLQTIVLQMGLPARAARLHNFRHTFAVRALENSPDGGQRVAEHMMAVSTYLGHARVSDTFWYLRSSPQLMIHIAEASERFMKGGTL
jgi:integrase/recombinase XerD